MSFESCSSLEILREAGLLLALLKLDPSFLSAELKLNADFTGLVREAAILEFED